MDFVYKSFRQSGVILNEPDFFHEFNEIIGAILSITDNDLINKYRSYSLISIESSPNNLSKAINDLLKEKLVAREWVADSGIFQDANYQEDTWKLDFTKKDISIVVGFNHSNLIAWTLTKHVLASELNHVKKAVQTQIGVIITATEELKQKGGFDSATGTYENYLDYLLPLNNILTTPLFIIGLKAPLIFVIKEFECGPKIKIGKIVML